jgi:two-component system C4-dicarboxylate transport sensor histidine kinase DctB
LAFSLITGMSWLSNREMERSLQRARASEKALIQERNHLEMKVEERTKELKELQSEKIAQLYRFAEFGKLSSGMFHDLMNMLNVVVINATRLEDSPSHLPEFKKYLHKTVTASKSIGRHIDIVRKQIAGDNSPSVFSMEKEINDAIDMLHFHAQETNVDFSFKIKDTVVISGNAIKFYHIILNILSNAVDACENNAKQGLVSIVLELDSIGEHAVVTIGDNGCGISPAVLDTIFIQFFTTKSYGKGMGLGLSQTKEIIEREFIGTIAVSSIEHEGTVFTIRIPIIER